MDKKAIIEMRNLVKSFGKLVAVDNVSLDIREGEIFGLLGPNGAGKTTIINMLLTLLPPTSGKILVSGIDVQKNRHKVKQLMGLMTQETIVEADLTARQNLVLFAKLYNLTSSQIRERVQKGLRDADLLEFAEAKAGTFSGGMKRRLGLVRAMIQRPKILVLDEPTTGLDVQNRSTMWNRLRELNKSGTTIILTTQYLDEADELCDRIAIIDHGKIIALGTPSEIRGKTGGGEVLDITVKSEQAQKVVSLLKSKFNIIASSKGDRIVALLDKKHELQFTKISEMLDKEKIEVIARGIHPPALDDVFIKLTGLKLRDVPGRMRGGQADTLLD